ncbi:MAG: PBP1A family penicillin-binding protein [Candidatus Hydrogenedentes bacterium]|nr:PBP1A family penicillin-binding protein [Candidatus Hydrogenedentota bacterium]
MEEFDPKTRTIMQPHRGCGGIFFAIMLVIGAAWGAGLGIFVYILNDAQSTIEALEEFRPKIGSKIYSSDGVLLGEFSIEERQLVPLNEMPQHVVKAFVATEDHPFYEHYGVRPEAMVSGVLEFFRSGRSRGGSTITQQVVRNVEDLNVGLERTPQRKIREAIVALQVEREFTKDEILELYLNQIFLGISAHGVEAAARQYFGIGCRDLTLGEAATLAGLTRAPNANNPIYNLKNAESRRNVVLGQMLEHAFITQEELDAAVAEDLGEQVITPEERAERRARGESVWTPNKFKAPYFVEEVRQFIYQHYPKDEVLEQGMSIYTTVDMRLQRAAQDTMKAALDHFDKNKIEYLTKVGKESEFVPVSGALICLDNRAPFQGFVRALVGGRDFDTQKFNMATQANRQVGSGIKPFVWAAAINNGMTPSTIVVDEPFVRLDGAGKAWRPANFSGDFRGPMPIRHALERSINIVSIKLVEQMSVPVVRSFFDRFGLVSDSAQGLTIALGTPQTTPLNLCAAYSVFPNKGVRHDPVMITEITNRDGLQRYNHTEFARTQEVISEDLAFVVTNMLKGVCNPDPKGGFSPTGAATAKLARPRAGKTGTTNESRDAWFCGFTPNYTCVVWLGYPDFRPLGQGRDHDNRTFTGGGQSCPIWTTFMIEAENGLPERDFIKPEGVNMFGIDRYRGTLGGSYQEAYLKGTQPPAQFVAATPGGEEAQLLETMQSPASGPDDNTF